MTPIIVLAPYQIDHIQHVFTLYRQSLKQKLYEGCKDQRQADRFTEELCVTDEVMYTFNALEGEQSGY